MMTYCLDRIMDERVADAMCANGWPYFTEVMGQPGLTFTQALGTYIAGIALVAIAGWFLDRNT